MSWKPSEPFKSIYYLTVSLYIYDLIIYTTDRCFKDEKLIYFIYNWNREQLFKNSRLERKLMKHRSKIFLFGVILGFLVAL